MRFQATCNFIVAFFRDASTDMAMRCTAGKSFYEYGSLVVLNLLGQKTAGKKSA